MRLLVVGFFLFASFGAIANAAESPSDTKATMHAKRLVCHWVTADRTLKLLRYTLPGERRAASERVVARPLSTPLKVSTVKMRGPVRRSEPVRLVSRPVSVHFERPSREHVSLIVGIGY
jgi:hypothetical protein